MHLLSGSGFSYNWTPFLSSVDHGLEHDLGLGGPGDGPVSPGNTLNLFP